MLNAVMDIASQKTKRSKELQALAAFRTEAERFKHTDLELFGALTRLRRRRNLGSSAFPDSIAWHTCEDPLDLATMLAHLRAPCASSYSAASIIRGLSRSLSFYLHFGNIEMGTLEPEVVPIVKARMDNATRLIASARACEKAFD